MTSALFIKSRSAGEQPAGCGDGHGAQHAALVANVSSLGVSGLSPRRLRRHVVTFVDRFIHAEVIDSEAHSYRLKEAKELTAARANRRSKKQPPS